MQINRKGEEIIRQQRFYQFIIIFIIIFLFQLFSNIICSAHFSEEVKSENNQTITQLEEWQETEENTLNDVISNSTEEDLTEFLNSLNEEETNELLEKDTILKNTVNEYEAEVTDKETSNQTLLKSEPYYQYLLNSKSESAFLSRIGHFFIQISGDGKTTKRKISVKLNSSDIKKEQTVSFSDVGVDGDSNNHNFKIITGTSKTKLTDDCYTILSMDFSYTKPAHYLAAGDYSNKVNGYRFNFRRYTPDNSGSSTVNNTGHNQCDVTENISLQINVANCGIYRSDDKYVASNATGYINLSKRYSSLNINPNGGMHNGNSNMYIYGTKTCGERDYINEPIRDGYAFIGWTITKGNNSSEANFNPYINEFTYCGNSKTTSVSSDNVCTLTANWKPNKSFILPETGGIDLDSMYHIVGIFIILIVIKFYKKKGSNNE
ncbi:MAG: hypothetical protein HFJ17_03705 [Clostridia bacterium]|nr:hypothetical protein [Clostridia bacterium]